MKKSGKDLFCGMMIAAEVLAVQPDAPAKTRRMMNHQFPKDMAGSKLDQWFAGEVAESTNREVEIKICRFNLPGVCKGKPGTAAQRHC